jgi:hypothetical protein
MTFKAFNPAITTSLSIQARLDIKVRRSLPMSALMGYVLTGGFQQPRLQ